MPDDEAKFNEIFKQKHAANIHDLMSDMVFMYRSARPRGLRMMARPLLESFFSLLACYKVSDFPLTKVADEFRDQIKRVQLWNNRYSGSGPEVADGQVMISAANANLAELESKYGAKPIKDWATHNVAINTNHPNQYRAGYFTYSLWTHCALLTLHTTGDINEVNETMKAMTGFMVIVLGELHDNQKFTNRAQLFSSFQPFFAAWMELNHP